MRKLLLLVIFAASIVFSSQAWAISYSLDIDLSSGGFAEASPWGEVELTQNGDDVDFTVTLFYDLEFVHTGAGAEAAFLFNALDVSTTDFKNPNPGVLAIMYGDPLLSTKGGFDFGVYFAPNTTGINQNAGPISFTILDSTIADFTNPNNDGYIFAADVIGAGPVTGLIAASTESVPEPATMFLLGIGLVGLVGCKRKLRK